MRKIMTWTIMISLVLLFAGCQEQSSAPEKKGTMTTEQTTGHKGDASEINTSSGATKEDELVLPVSYPKEILPLAVDAEILDVRENVQNKGIEVSYVSDNDIKTLRDFYEGALKDAKDLNTIETSGNYMISANIDGVGYTVMISKDAMSSNPKYAGKKSVYIVVTGLDGEYNGEKQMPDGDGEAWPSADLPGVPEFKGYISHILRDGGIIYLDILVENNDFVKSYIDELAKAGFRFEAEPDLESDHVQFIAFKGDSILNFSYKAKEDFVTIEYQK